MTTLAIGAARARRAGYVVLAALAVALSGPAHAQETGGASPDDAPDEAAGETAVEAIGAEEQSSSPAFGNVDASKVPSAQKKARVEEMVSNQRATLGRVTEILAEARSSKDIVQLNCVNEKLTQVKGLLKISEQASLEMYEAIATTASDVANHEYTKVVVAHQKSQVLRAEAEQCVGESSIYAGNTEVDVEIDGDSDGGGGFGSDPTTAGAPPPGPAVPPVASTF